MNEVRLIARLGRDPKMSGLGKDRIALLSVVTNDYWRDDKGVNVVHEEWHDILCAGRLAEVAELYLSKGAEVFIAGSLRSWQPSSGTRRVQIRAERLKLLRGPKDGRLQEEVDRLRSISRLVEKIGTADGPDVATVQSMLALVADGLNRIDAPRNAAD